MEAENPDVPVIEFRDVSYESPTGQKVLAGLNLEVRRGETLVLLGRSGSGKTTTLKLVNRGRESKGRALRYPRADAGLHAAAAAAEVSWRTTAGHLAHRHFVPLGDFVRDWNDAGTRVLFAGGAGAQFLRAGSRHGENGARMGIAGRTYAAFRNCRDG
jgi:energy-coupling factor transporter ATP-binding protein EcfA2